MVKEGNGTLKNFSFNNGENHRSGSESIEWHTLLELSLLTSKVFKNKKLQTFKQGKSINGW